MSKHGYPGIVYDFVIDGSGQVFKVTELEDVAEPGLDWSLHGVTSVLPATSTRRHRRCPTGGDRSTLRLAGAQSGLDAG